MSQLQWSIGESLPREDVKFIEDRVFEYGRALAVGGQAAPLACVVRDVQNVVAGASGRTEYSRLFVQSLWVHESLRCTGIGTELLRRIEQAALSRDCVSALIETLNERACCLYQRLGYKVIAHVPDYVGPFSRHILLKPLGEA